MMKCREPLFGATKLENTQNDKFMNIQNELETIAYDVQKLKRGYCISSGDKFVSKKNLCLSNSISDIQCLSTIFQILLITNYSNRAFGSLSKCTVLTQG